jgi:hypothetical protein
MRNGLKAFAVEEVFTRLIGLARDCPSIGECLFESLQKAGLSVT